MKTFAGLRLLLVEPYRERRCLCGACDSTLPYFGMRIITEDGRDLAVPPHWIETHPDPPGWEEEEKRLRSEVAARMLRPVAPGRFRGQDGSVCLLDPITEVFAVMAQAFAVRGYVREENAP